MSSAFPCGTPSTMSNSTTSPNSLSPANRASVPPIWPAPTSAILLRAIGKSLCVRCVWRAGDGAVLPRIPAPGKAGRWMVWPRARALNPAIGEVVLALHLDQPRDGALEFKGAVPRHVDLLGRYVGRGDEQGARLV